MHAFTYAQFVESGFVCKMWASSRPRASVFKSCIPGSFCILSRALASQRLCVFARFCFVSYGQRQRAPLLLCPLHHSADCLAGEHRVLAKFLCIRQPISSTQTWVWLCLLEQCIVPFNYITWQLNINLWAQRTLLRSTSTVLTSHYYKSLSLWRCSE